MKKKLFFPYRTLIAATLLLSTITGCKKLIEIPANPPTQITQEQQFGDSTTTMTALAGVYTYASSSGMGFAYDDGLHAEITPVSADELLATSNTEPLISQFYNYSVLPANGYLSQLWGNHYNNLYSVNAILAGVAGNAQLSKSFRNQVTGEMKVLRSLYYFNLVNLFGGVPVVTSTDYKVNSRLPRSTEDSVYSKIITDLTDAQKLLKPGYPAGDRYRPNLYVANALLSRVYLYRQQWQKAYDAANSVISSGIYSLVNDPGNVFLDKSAEALWQLPATGPQVVTTDAQNFVPRSNTAVPAFPVSPFLLSAFEDGDSRKQKWLGTTKSGGQTYYYPYKYKNLVTTATLKEDYMVLRLAELYLIRAEALQHLGRNNDALSDVNTVRRRAGLTGSKADPSSDSAVSNAIMHERQVELFCEWGHRWYDLKRTGSAATVLSQEKTGFKSFQQLYPIPLGELQANNLLQQNPGY